MRIRKGLLVLAAVALPVSSVLLTEGTAFAGKTTGAGSTTCHITGSITFSPPLSSAGTPNVKKSITTVNASLTGCSGGTPAPTGAALTIKPIKTKTAKGSNAATCSGFAGASSTAVVKSKVAWTGGTTLKPSKFTVSGLHVSINGMGEAGFTGSAPVSGSYAGTGSIAAYLTQADSTAIATCSGSISTVHFDTSQSTATL